MIEKNLPLLFKLYYQPLTAMSSIVDEGSWLFGAVAVVIVSVMLTFGIARPLFHSVEAVKQTIKITPQERASYIEDGYPKEEIPETRTQIQKLPLPLIGNLGWWFISFTDLSTMTSIVPLALLYIPATILAIILFESLGSFGVVLRRDYGPLLACTMMGWTAAHLPIAIAALLLASVKLSSNQLLLMLLGSKLLFGFFMVFAMRAIFGARVVSAVAAVSVSWLALVLQSFLFWISSPFILLWLYGYIQGEVGSDIIASYQRRQSFRRNLEACTVNPRDAEAHYQLGLIYQYRRQYTEAITRFKQAIEIDKREIDAHFQLGVIARTQQRLQEAIGHFEAVLSLDDKHAHSEIWREIGATYQSAAMYDDARTALDRYVERRPYDAEGLYYYGRTLSKLGQVEPAREMLKRCIEAVQTSPNYRRSQIRRWQKLANEELRAIPNVVQGVGV